MAARLSKVLHPRPFAGSPEIRSALQSLDCGLMVGYQEGAILLLADDISIPICRPGFTVSACASSCLAYVETSPLAT